MSMSKNGNLCTIILHMNNLQISHVEKKCIGIIDSQIIYRHERLILWFLYSRPGHEGA